MAEKTIFDRILDHEIKADIVHEDDDILAFRDINPQAPIHVLVIPKRRIAAFPDLERTETGASGRFLGGIALVARKLGLNENGYRVVFNCGTHGQQTVQYLHAHILGGRQMNWPPG